MATQIRHCGWNCFGATLPSGFVFMLLGWSIYVDLGLYLPECLRNERIFIRALGSLQASLYVIFWGFSLSHFTRTLLEDNSPERSPAYLPLQQQIQQQEQNTNSNCRKCNGNPKPIRCHHCSVCGKCCLKMDHHCPWVGNCVGFYNYKFFWMFLFFSLLLCLFVIASTIPYVVHLIKNFKTEFIGSSSQVQIIVHAFVAFVFGFSVVMLFGMHVILAAHNTTTLEQSDEACSLRLNSRQGPFDLGASENYKQVFGKNKLMWFMPIFTSEGDGFSFPMREMNTPTDEV